jgi:hypothetical protein
VTFVFPLVALVVGAGILATELNWDRQIGVVSITDGHLTLLRDPLAPARQWPVKNVANVSAWVYANVWELKVELKEGKPVCCFRGRSRVELQFCAGLLRAALAPPRPALAPPRPALAPPRPAPVEKVVYVAGGVCQICGTAMDDRIVYCAKCRTPHHEECWMYNGACSTYGCREIRMTRSA